MKKNILIVPMVGAALLCLTGEAQASLVLYSTGASGAAGKVDSNYTITGSTGSEPLIQLTSGTEGTKNNDFLIGNDDPWVANPSDANWISPWTPTTSTDPWVSDANNSTYIFSTIAQASGTVSGVFASDNTAEIYINGVYTGIDNASSKTPTDFTLNLIAGDIVTFDVFNGIVGNGESTTGNPAGLLVDVTSTTFSAVPETTTMVAGALLLLPFGASTLRILRKSRTA